MKEVSGELLQKASDFLAKRGVKGARRSAEELLAHTLSKKRLDLYLTFDELVSENAVDDFREKIKRRALGEPVQQILGSVDFCSLPLKVTRDVLIPRPETEQLAALILEEVQEEALGVWDVCCGSGCLGLALKAKRPSWQVTLSDISEAALGVARENAQEMEVEFLQGDLLTPFQGRKSDLIVCNPPYVSLAEYGELDAEVRDFEPKLALVGGETGLEFYERLAREVGSFLKPGGRVYLEIGAGQGERVVEIFSSASFVEVRLRQDWSGRDRFISL